MKIEKNYYFYLFVCFVFLGIVCFDLFSDGMFMDGLLYADISRNMSEGLGSFWQPHFSNTLLNEFYEHPPLAFGLQSLWFKIFGDSIYVERLYSLFTYIVVAYLIVLIWGNLTNDRKTAWIPLLFWLITADVIWSVSNNMLENTMTIFVCLSVLFYFKSFKDKRFMWIVLSGLSISLGCLTKGFFCLYIWSMPFFVWLFKRERTFIQMFLETIVLIFSTIMPIALLYLIVPAAKNNFLHYFNKQVMGSIKEVVTVDSRFNILFVFLRNIIVHIVIVIIVILIAFRKNFEKKLLKQNLKESLLLFVIVLSGILPIMISMKQRNFYILTVYPLFALGLAYFIYPLLKPMIDRIKTDSIGFRIFKILTFLIVISSISLSVMQLNKIGRDQDVINDCKLVINVVGENSTINICHEMHSVWNLHGYFARYGNVSLDRNQNNMCQYYLSANDCNKEYLNDFYELVPLKLNNYQLYKLKNYYNK